MREISAGIMVYRKTAEGPRFLILYHGHGNWNFPKGKIASEEKSFQTAVREVREETGLTRNDLRFNENFKTSENFTFWRNKEKVYKTIVLYLAETASQRIRLPEKREDEEGERHEGYGWFTYKEALKVLVKEDSRRVLKQAYNFLRNQEVRKKRDMQRPQQRSGQQRQAVVVPAAQGQEDQQKRPFQQKQQRYRRQMPIRREDRRVHNNAQTQQKKNSPSY